MVIVGSGRQSVAHQNTKRTCRSRVVIGAFKLSLGRLHREPGLPSEYSVL